MNAMPAWTKSPATKFLGVPDLFEFEALVGISNKPCLVIARIATGGYCDEIVSVSSIDLGDLDIADYLSIRQLADLCKQAEAKFCTGV